MAGPGKREVSTKNEFDIGRVSLQSRFKKPKEEPVAVPTPTGNGDSPRFLTLKHASAYLGLPLKRIRILVPTHTIKRTPEKAHAIRIAREELDRYVGEQIKNSF